jgi:hypothetical protein
MNNFLVARDHRARGSVIFEAQTGVARIFRARRPEVDGYHQTLRL